MFLLAEVIRMRRSPRPVSGRCAGAVLWAGVMSAALAGCASWRFDRDPAPVVQRAATPVAAAPVAAAMDPASAPPSAPAAIAPADLVTPGDLASRQLLAYHDQLRMLPPNDLAQEINRLAALPAAPDTSLELALALMQTRNGGELNRAIALVEPWTRGVAEPRPWQPFARLLMSRLLELRRLEDLLEKRNQELRDSQREVRQLNEKLEALKAIERSLAPRPSSAAPSAGVLGATWAAPLRRTP